MAFRHLCTGLILQCLILCKCSETLDAPKDNTTGELLLRHIGRALAQCLSQAHKWQCLELQLTHVVDTATHNNNTWQLNDFVIIEKRIAAAADSAATPTLRQQRSLSANASSLGAKLLQLAKSRTIRLQLPKAARPLQSVGSGISDAIDSLSSIAAAAAAPGIDGALLESVDEGRKKKDHDKNMAMMGGMAMMAILAQMFLGKVILIAGAAFVMAKIALLVSVLGSLKKGTGGSSGSTTEHVIVTSGGGGGGHGGGGGGHGHGHDSHDSGWHRSMPYDSPKLEVISEAPSHHDDSGPPAHQPSHPSAPPASGGHEHSSYYNYEVKESDEGGGGGEYKRQHSAGFL